MTIEFERAAGVATFTAAAAAAARRRAAARAFRQRFTAGMLLVTLIAMACLASPASADNRYAAMAIDANTGQVLHSEAADEPRYPASLTKMMTLYLVFEALEQGRLRPDTPIRVSSEATAVSPSKLGLQAGSTIAAGDAIRALITKSANDMAVAFAEHLGGDETRFAEAMTRKARELGMPSTTFRNPHGLPDRGQITTARDMLTLAMRLYDRFPNQSRLFATRTFQYAGRSYRNHNTMLDNFPGMDGVKTGYTALSGFNLVASVHRDGRHVLAAVFGGPTAGIRNARMRVILTRALLMASPDKTRRPLVASSRPAPRLASADESAPRTARPAPERRQPPRPPRAQTAPVLVEGVSPAVRQPTRVAEVQAAAPAPQPQPWRSSVRLAAPIGDTSVAARLGGAEAIRQPSTLQAQAAQLPTARPAAPIQASATAARHVASGTGIQIGAFPSEAEARSKVEQARRLLPSLAGATPATPTVHVNGRTLYRARFVGLDQSQAASACTELRRREIDCLVTRTE